VILGALRSTRPLAPSLTRREAAEAADLAAGPSATEISFIFLDSGRPRARAINGCLMAVDMTELHLDAGYKVEED
jgi:hypothetical protein